MFTRIVTSQGKPEKVEEGVRSFREKVIPELKKQKGFKQAYFMVNRENGKYTAVSFWKNEQVQRILLPLPAG